jgi:hypothetical protein
MTIIFGLIRDNYAILGADTRVTYFPRNEPSFYQDDATKLVNFNGGWIAGAGSGNFINTFNKETSTQPIFTVDQIEQIYLRMLALNNVSEDGIEKDLFLTTQISYLFAYSNDQGLPEMHIEALHPIAGRRGISGPNTFISFGQSDNEAQTAIVNEYKGKINPVSDLSTTILHCASFVEAMSAVNQYVSPICDLGILVKTSDQQVDIFRIRDNSSSIIKSSNPLDLKQIIHSIS